MTSSYPESHLRGSYLRDTYQPVPTAALADDEPPPRSGSGPRSGRWPVTVAVVARDEQRCIRRCVDSVLAAPVDAVLVIDTGSTDRTLAILDGYGDERVEVVRHRWADSFAEARNTAIARARPGWIVFVDADEWFAEGTAEALRPCLSEFERVPGVSLAALAPTIREADSGVSYYDVARIMPTWTLRFHGEVHEYPYVPGHDLVPGLIGISLELMHDGYQPEVAVAKRKRERNLSLADRARAREPHNPRWLYYYLRDGLWELSSADVVALCAKLADADRPGPGDRHSPDTYHRRTLAQACTRLAQLGDWPQTLAYCDDLDRLTPPGSPDAVYFRGLYELVAGPGAGPRGLRAAVRIRRDATAMARSGLDVRGRPLDALIAAYLRDLKGPATANTYLAMCDSWTDPFFDASRLRR